LINAAIEYKENSGGKKLRINSARRDPAKQKELHDAWIAGGMKGLPVAAPGSSLHEVGKAVDIQNYRDRDAITAMNNHGLSQKVPDDPVHFQMKYGGIASGPQTGFPVMLHGPKEAVIPLATDSILEKMATTPASTFANPATSNTSDSMLISMLVDKFDAMINLLSDGNDIQDQLLRHSRI
jgi:hypothetical protein